MAYQPFLIANTRVGLERDLEPWLIPQDAYPELEDCYIWRGRIKKKQGYVLLGRLVRKIGKTDAGGNFGPFVLPNFPLSLGVSSFIIGTDLFQDPQVTAGDPVTLLTNGAAITKTLNRSNGTLTITNSQPLTDVLYQPGLPVMGLRTLDSTAFNQGLLVGFDTRFSYLFNTVSQTFNDLSNYRGTATIFNWHGTDSQFFWTTNYAGALWATNNVPGFQGQSTATTAGQGDGIKWLDQDQTGWVNFLPNVSGVNAAPGTIYLQAALIIVPYKDRLVVLNTVEGTSFAVQQQFPQRARWSQNGTPFNNNDQSGGLAPQPTNFFGGKDANNNAWRSDVVGRGGFIDAPTLEKIVSAEFLKDTLIVYFESSTWRLSYTGNEALPFIWEKINTELGATSTFSEIPFDEIVLGIGDVGVHASGSYEVQRIDQKIPDEVFGIQNANQGRQRTYGIRDYFTQLVYWAAPYVGSDQQQAIDDEGGEVPPPGISLIYPNKIFCYNYIDRSYSMFNDSFTCFGYYQRAADIRWQDVLTEWQSTTFNWVGPENQQLFPFIVGGNQLGFVEVFDPKSVFNGDSLFITNITPGTPTTTIICPNHNLNVGQFVKVTSSPGITGLAGSIYKIVAVTDANTFTVGTNPAPTGVYTGSGTLTVVSNINIITKRFNPFLDQGQKVRLGFVDLYVDRTTNGAFTVNVYIDEDATTPINSGVGNLATNTVNTFPETTYAASPQTNMVQAKLWKRLYVEDISQLFQLQITLNDLQMETDNIVESDIVLHGMILWFSTSGRLTNV